MKRFISSALATFFFAANLLSCSHAQSSCPVGFVENDEGSCEPDQQLRCPPGTVFMYEKCRKIMCPAGELYNDICIVAACPPGLVWRGKRCQEPGYMTTILEIENHLTNQLHEGARYYEKSVHNEFVVHNSTSAPEVSSTYRPTTTGTSTARPTISDDTGCCTLRTPRICKRYDQKWICFNRSQKLCDSRVCMAPIVYLKAPEIKYAHPLLIMPPGAIIENCHNGNCEENDTKLPDCSGCASNHPENCSSYCFLYMCPSGTCSYMNLDLYCSYYPGQFGCIKEDGCLWNWC